MDSTTRTIADIRAELAEAEAAEARRVAALKDTVKPQYGYRADLAAFPDRHFVRGVYASYRITRIVLNREELEAVGARAEDSSGSYLLNRQAGHFVNAGGGTYFLPVPGFNSVNLDYEGLYAPLAAWLVEHPNGGDITALCEQIIARHAAGLV